MWLTKAHTSQEAPTSISGSSSPNQGDNLEKDREIDHWLYFSSEENINIAIKKVEELGYKILSSKKLDDEKNYPYQLNISRMDSAIYSHVNQIVWELIEIAKPLNGYYDG